MKIALTTNTSWNIYNFRMGLVNYLKGQGHQVYFFAPADQFSSKIESAGDGYYPLRMQNTGSNPLADIWLFAQLYYYYWKTRPDIVLHYTIKPNIYGAFAARLLGIPVINNVSGLGTIFTSKGYATLVAKWLYKIAFRGKMHVFFQNIDDQHDFTSQIPLSVSHSVIPGSGINLEQFVPLRHQPANGKTTFLFIGRMLIDKGVMEYIEAAKSISREAKGAVFQMAGDIDEGHVRSISRHAVQKHHDDGTIQYLGHVANIADYIAAADWIVLPSYREGTSRILLEAAAMGKPIIATDVPGCRNVVHDGQNGYLCAARDSGALASAIQKALQTDAVTLVDFAKNSREIAELEFDEKLVFNAYYEAILRLKPLG